jgi:hypothetical protein
MKIIKFMPAVTASVLLLFMLAGCQGIEDQIGKTIAEKAIEGATGGSMQVNRDTGDIKIKTPEGEAVFGGGDTRPASVPEDLSSLDGAIDFSWAGSQAEGMFSFTVKDVDYKKACETEIGLLTAKGWALDDQTLMEFEGMTNRSLAKEGFSLSLNCSADKEGKKVTVVMIKSKKTP